MSRSLLPRLFVLLLAVLGLLPGVYMMLWFAWLSAGPGWAEQQVGIVLGFTLSTAWVVGCLGLGGAAVYSTFHGPTSR